MIRVALIAQSPALRAGLRSLLAEDGEIAIVNEQDKWGDSPISEQNEADVVITTSASLTSLLADDAENLLRASILFLGDEPLNIQWVSRVSYAWGVLALDSSTEELCAAVRALAQGLIVGSRALLFASNQETPARGPLTERETQVLALLSKGLANKQIAAELKISEHTVKFHVSSIYAKLNAASRTQAVREGLRRGWIAL